MSARPLEERIFGYLRRDDSWLRRRTIGEEWVQYRGYVPPEMAAELDARIGRPDGPRSRSDIILAGLRIYLEVVDPEEPEPIETSAVDVPPLRAARYLKP